MEMKYPLKALVLTFTALMLTTTARAEDIRHTYAGDPLNSFYIDDAGGSVDNGGSNNSYFLNLLDIDQSAFGTLLLYADDGANTTVDDGLIDEDFQNGSGINLYPLSSLPMSSSAGEMGLASDSPLTPVSYDATQSGLIVEQASYTSENPGDNFVIVEYRVTNPTNSDVTARIALSNDFDVDLKSDDAKVGFDNSVAPMVFQQEAPPIDPNYTTVGVSITRGSLAQYRLEVCSGVFGPCQIFADDNDLIRTGFFENAGGQVGDLTGGIPNQDFAVTISALLGTLAPGESASVVFCYNLGQGDTSNDALNNCKNAANNCSDFYQNEIQNCGNGLVNFGENCDDGDNDQSDSCPDGVNGSCEPASCGDGFTWSTDGGTETCDDGNNNIHDSCPDGVSGKCLDAVCGDGFLWDTDGGSEQCDNGGANSNSTPDACRTNCQTPHCGDSVKDTGEGCDDGDVSNNDACLNNCKAAACGDGVIFNTEGGAEQCDNGGANSNNTPNACRTNCQNAHCGDGVTDAGEQCDDSNGSNNDACLNSCLSAKCGDTFVRVGSEFCDDGNNTNGDGCSADCQSFESCGNGQLDPGEACDDGNQNTSDACPDGIHGICQPASCGDGFLNNTGGGTEQCDDGNKVSGDGCSSTCINEGVGTSVSPFPTPPVCGDGKVDESSGEQCDDGNNDEFDGCDNSCQWVIVLQGSGGPNAPRENFGNCRLNSGSSQGAPWSLFPVLAGILFLGQLRRHRREQAKGLS